MYEYAIGGSEKFPKSVISKGTLNKLVEIAPEKETSVTKSANKDIILARISNIELVNTVKEQQKKLEDLENMLGKERDERKKMEDKFTQDIEQMNAILLQIKTFCDIIPADTNGTVSTANALQEPQEARTPKLQVEFLLLYRKTCSK